MKLMPSVEAKWQRLHLALHRYFEQGGNFDHQIKPGLEFLAGVEHVVQGAERRAAGVYRGAADTTQRFVSGTSQA